MKKLLLAFALIGFIATTSFAAPTVASTSSSIEFCDDCDGKDCTKKDCKHDKKATADKKACSKNKKSCCASKTASAKKACCAKKGTASASKSADAKKATDAKPVKKENKATN